MPSSVLIMCALDTVKWMLEVQSMGLMHKVIPEWLKASVS